ncbi:MAG: hypothetical protein LBU73_09485 [Helicobacteraceae bacterium]|jgi:hypothetical protein|nr:hypothetical protein [Helicobacteraceae bacterium]
MRELSMILSRGALDRGVTRGAKVKDRKTRRSPSTNHNVTYGVKLKDRRGVIEKTHDRDRSIAAVLLCENFL